MKRLASAVALAVAALASPLQAPPAAAHTDACAGNGVMQTAGEFFELVVDPLTPRTSGFFVSLTVGTCVVKGGVSMAGTISGWCGFSSAQGITDTGHRFVFINVGTALLFTGDVDGAGTSTANAMAGQSCVGGATNFLINLAVDLRHCTITKTKHETRDPLFGVVFWAKVCA